MLLTVYFFMVIALPLAIGLLVLHRGLPRTRRCPGCARETARLRSQPHRLASRLLRSEQIHLRWCMDCGWKGTVRVARPESRAVPRRLPDPVRSAINGLRQPDSVDIRSLDVDGRAVRVRVQCWAEGGEWHGRLLFTLPEGRTCVEEGGSIRGSSALEVLSSALTLTDQTLTGRLRQVMS